MMVASVEAAPPPAQRPNIVMIIADDQAYSDFGFMGNRDVRTSHIDRLAARSARYVSAYVPSSVCRPSLVTLLTGLYPHQHGVHFNHPPPGFAALTRSADIDKQRFDELRGRATSLIRAVPTLPRLLAADGYRCLQTGKYWEGHWKNAGFTEGMTVAQPEPNAKYGNKKLIGGEVVAHGNGDHGLAIGRETMQPIHDFIDECGETPFFVWYAPFLPHLPHDSPPRFRDLYKNNPRIPSHRIPYYAACSQFDETVGELLKHVETKGLAEKTLFVFVSDNGFVPDAKRPMADGDFNYTRRSKRAPFDDGLRTPILIRWDGRVKPDTHRVPCSSVDLVPTLLHAVGLKESTVEMPGRNLLPAAFGDKPLKPRPVFGAIYPGDATSLGHPERDVAYRWVRNGDLKLIVPHTHGSRYAWNRYLEAPALFDVSVDPGETKDLINDPTHKTDIAQLRELLDRWWKPGETR
jgi:uncharacterized sulfatase